MSFTRFFLEASTTPSFEPLLARELKRIISQGQGYLADPKVARASPRASRSPDASRPPERTGVVTARVTARGLWDIIHHSRLARRVRVEVGPTFDCTSYKLMAQAMQRMPWRSFFPAHGVPLVKVRTARSHLFHEQSLDRRLAHYLSDRLAHRKHVPVSQQAKEETPFVARPDRSGRFNKMVLKDVAKVNFGYMSQVMLDIVDNKGQFYVDAVGGLQRILDRRGYRVYSQPTSLAEHRAAAVVQLVHEALQPAALQQTASAAVTWPAMWDPFCGSGTLCIEWAAAISGVCPTSTKLMDCETRSKEQPGNSFAFETWLTHKPEDYQQYLLSLCRSSPTALNLAASVIGSDLDPEAISAAKHNVALSNVACSLVVGDFDTVSHTIPHGACIITNIPYSEVEDSEDVLSLYRRFGKMLIRRTDIRDVFVLCSNRRFRESTGLQWDPVMHFFNGPILVTLHRLRRINSSSW